MKYNGIPNSSMSIRYAYILHKYLFIFTNTYTIYDNTNILLQYKIDGLSVSSDIAKTAKIELVTNKPELVTKWLESVTKELQSVTKGREMVTAW